jgi:hypothetical protein
MKCWLETAASGGLMVTTLYDRNRLRLVRERLRQVFAGPRLSMICETSHGATAR